MVRVAERLEGRYEVQGVPFGKVYAWRPGCIILECDCGERLTLTSSAAICVCGADHALTVGEELAAESPGDEVLHPWRYVGNSEDNGLLF